MPPRNVPFHTPRHGALKPARTLPLKREWRNDIAPEHPSTRKHASCCPVCRPHHTHHHRARSGGDMRKRILIVEDNEDVALGLTVRFAGAGFEVRSVPTASEGLKAIDLFEPELVLLDLLVPGGGGYSVLKALRGAPHTGGVPVIVMT